MINEGKIVFNTTGGKQSSFRNTWFCVSIIKLELLFNIINLNSQHYCSANYRVKNVISSPFPCMWNIKSTMWKCLQAFAQLSSHQMCIDNLSVHAPLAELGHQRLRTCLKCQFNCLYSLVYFYCGYHPSLAVHCLTWLWEQLSFPFPKPLWDSEVFDLLCWSVSAVPDVRCSVWNWVLGAKQEKSRA